jgi:hypothetical protein
MATLLVRGGADLCHPAGPARAPSLFANWTREQWLGFRDDVDETVRLALRPDATEMLSGPQDRGKERQGGAPVPELDWLAAAKRIILVCITANAAVAPIRQVLDTLVEGVVARSGDGRIDLQGGSCLAEYVYVAAVSRALPSLLATL